MSRALDYFAATMLVANCAFACTMAAFLIAGTAHPVGTAVIGVMNLCVAALLFAVTQPEPASQESYRVSRL